MSYEVSETVHEVSRLLFDQGFRPSTMGKALRLVGEAVRADRVYVFENGAQAGTGRLVMNQRFEWSASSAAPQLDNPELQNLPYAESVPSWVGPLRAGEHVTGLVRVMPRTEQALLASQEIQSILVCPVTLGGRWWGFVGFDDCRDQRDWSPPEIILLKGLSKALAGGLQHASTRRSLDGARESLRDVIRQCERLSAGPKIALR
jgi:GAF domain-containing protein